LTLKPIFDEETLEQLKACTRAKFPQCLNDALLKMFDQKGKEILDGMFKQVSLVSSSSDVWNVYNEYLSKVKERLGVDVAQVIRFESLKEMNSMSCTKCPLYKKTE
jgi:hypothetical protein